MSHEEKKKPKRNWGQSQAGYLAALEGKQVTAAGRVSGRVVSGPHPRPLPRLAGEGAKSEAHHEVGEVLEGGEGAKSKAHHEVGGVPEGRGGGQKQGIPQSGRGARRAGGGQKQGTPRVGEEPEGRGGG